MFSNLSYEIIKKLKSQNGKLVEQLYQIFGLHNNIPIDLVRLVEELGGHIFDTTCLSNDPDDLPFDFYSKEPPEFTIYINEKSDYRSRRFQIARGLARFFLYSIACEQSKEKIPDFSLISSKWLVDDFARKFLVPDFLIIESFHEDGSLPTIHEAAQFFDVPESLIVIRFEELKIFY